MTCERPPHLHVVSASYFIQTYNVRIDVAILLLPSHLLQICRWSSLASVLVETAIFLMRSTNAANTDASVTPPLLCGLGAIVVCDLVRLAGTSVLFYLLSGLTCTELLLLRYNTGVVFKVIRI